MKILHRACAVLNLSDWNGDRPSAERRYIAMAIASQRSGVSTLVWRNAKFPSHSPWVVVSQDQALLCTIRDRSFDENLSRQPRCSPLLVFDRLRDLNRHR